MTFTDGLTTVKDVFILYSFYGCLLAGTLVLMSNGEYKDISTIEEGEKIVCYDINTQVNIDVEVQGVYVADNCDDVYYLYFDDGSKIACTSLHKWMTDSGWKAIAPNTEGIGTLSVNDTVKLRDGSCVTITAIECDTITHTVYHLYMEQEYVMYVTDVLDNVPKMSDTYMPDYSISTSAEPYG